MPEYSVTKVSVLRPYVVKVTFVDGYTREVDIEPFLKGEVFTALRDVTLFSQVSIDPVARTIFWPNGADLAPEFLRYGAERPEREMRKTS